MSDLNMISSDNLLQESACCGGGACGSASDPATADGTTESFQVAGMTCDHCVSSVTSELMNLEGVREVQVELGGDAASTVRVTSDAPLDAGAVRAAIDEAGYSLAE